MIRRCLLFAFALSAALHAQTNPQSPAAKQIKKPAAQDSSFDAGTVTNGVYHNKSLALSCKIPPGWVLRTDELNLRDEKSAEKKEQGRREGTT